MAELIPHPAFPPARVRRVEARAWSGPSGWLLLRWRVEGSSGLVVPPFAGSARVDELWRTTCFELFCRHPGEEAYAELNFSPSERWAAYRFTNYRDEMAPLPLARPPVITPRRGREVLIFDVALRLADLPAPPLDMALTAVLEEEGGELSYWAQVHTSGRPDFHSPDCFALRFEPPEAP